MKPTRRDLLRAGLGTTLLACDAAVPAFLARSAAAVDQAHGNGRVLVVLQLDGGNDGLNTVVPYRDDEYRKRRPRLRLDEMCTKIDDHVALHPALHGFAQELQAGRLAIIQGVGYPNPNRSHFESAAIWQTARLEPGPEDAGWLARWMESHAVGEQGDALALHVDSGKLPQALAGSRRHVPSLASLEQFRRRIGVPSAAGAAEQRAALDEVASQANLHPGSLLDFVQRGTTLTYTSSARLENLLSERNSTTQYPQYYRLAHRLKLIAQLIKAGLSTSIYYTQLTGFDTHADQLNDHYRLLGEMAASLGAFSEDLRSADEGDRVLVLVFSEFGRRLEENSARGTDHGTAAPVFLLGQRVHGGLHGRHPDLRDLDPSGDPKHTVDFRQVYATVLERWLGCPARKVLGTDFSSLPVL